MDPEGTVEVFLGRHPDNPNLAFEINELPFRQWFSGQRPIISLGFGCGLRVTIGAEGTFNAGKVMKFAECFRTGKDPGG